MIACESFKAKIGTKPNYPGKWVTVGVKFVKIYVHLLYMINPEMLKVVISKVHTQSGVHKSRRSIFLSA